MCTFQTCCLVVISHCDFFPACPSAPSIPALPSHTSCSLTSFCSGVVCCTDVALLKTSIQSEVKIDRCKGKVFIQLERLEVVIILSKFDFSVWQKYTLQNVFRLEWVWTFYFIRGYFFWCTSAWKYKNNVFIIIIAFYQIQDWFPVSRERFLIQHEIQCLFWECWGLQTQLSHNDWCEGPIPAMWFQDSSFCHTRQGH